MALRIGGYYIEPVLPSSQSATRMPTGPETSAIADPHVDSRSLLGAMQSHGVARTMEYRRAVVIICEPIWLKRLLKDLQVDVFDPTMIYCDNLNSIQLAKNIVFYARTKHIEVHYHFVHERVLSGEVERQFVPKDRQNADIFTKPLGLDKLRCREKSVTMCGSRGGTGGVLDQKDLKFVQALAREYLR